MKKTVSLLLCLLLLVGSFAMAEEEKVLNIISWEGYIDDDTLAAFETETGIKIIWSPMEDIESMIAKVRGGAIGDYDLILTSDYSLDTLRQLGLIQKLDKTRLANFDNLNPLYLNQFYDPDNEYVIPYMAGCPLIIYDEAATGFELTGYEDLWDERLKENVALLGNARVICGITLKTLGYSFNETDHDILLQMKEKLASLRPNLRTANDTESYTAVVTGDAAVGFLFTPFVYFLQMDREAEGLAPLKVVYPKEGLGFGIDGLVITSEAKHPENAHLFLDYLMRPDVAAHNAEMQGYMCVNKAAEEYLSEEFRSAGEVNVPEDVVLNAEMILSLGETETEYQEIYTAFLNQF